MTVQVDRNTKKAGYKPCFNKARLGCLTCKKHRAFEEEAQDAWATAGGGVLDVLAALEEKIRKRRGPS